MVEFTVISWQTELPLKYYKFHNEELKYLTEYKFA